MNYFVDRKSKHSLRCPCRVAMITYQSHNEYVVNSLRICPVTSGAWQLDVIPRGRCSNASNIIYPRVVSRRS